MKDHVKLETAKRLAEAGIVIPDKAGNPNYPLLLTKGCKNKWQYDRFDDTWVVTPYDVTLDANYESFPAPTTNELLEILPNTIKDGGIYYGLTIKRININSFEVYYTRDNIINAESINEALAEMAILLTKEGYM